MKNVMRYILRIARLNAQYRCEMTKDMDFNGYECQYIICVCNHPGITQDQISKHLCIDKSNVTRKLTSLEENGYIERIPLPEDKRNLQVFPTEKAKAVLPLVEKITGNWSDYLTSDFTEEEKTKLEEMMERIREKARHWEEYDFEKFKNDGNNDDKEVDN